MPQGKQAKLKRATKREIARVGAHKEAHPKDKQAQGKPMPKKKP